MRAQFEARFAELQQSLMKGPLAEDAADRHEGQASQAPFSPPSSHASAPQEPSPGGASVPVSSPP